YTAGVGTSLQLNVAVTNSTGCYSNSTKVVTIYPLPSCSVSGASAVCAASANNTYTADAGMSAYSWTISGGTIVGSATSQTVNVTAGTGASFTVTSTVTEANGCKSTCSKTVTLITRPTATVSGSTTICTGGSATIQAALTG